MISVVALRCEYFSNPIGIDFASPRLMWRIQSDQENVMQTAYHIIAECNSQTVWDSGKVESDQSIHISYDGSPLESRKRYTWRVKVWDNTGSESEWSASASWEIGLLNKEDWTTRWIEPEEEINPDERQPCPYLRRKFELADKEITEARAYVTSHGLYALSINGNMLDENLLTPGFTSYHKRLQYQTYDLSNQLKNGENVIGVILADGWWRGKTGGLSLKNVYGERLALLCQLHVLYSDGSEDVIISDENWKTKTGALLLSDMKDGDIYDARLEMNGWNSSGFDDSNWNPVTVVNHGYDNLVAQTGVPIHRHETFKGKLIKTPSGETVLEFPQNIAGRIRFTLQAPEGTTIKLTHGETLDKQGNFTLNNLNPGKIVSTMFNTEDLKQEIIYTFKGGAPETYETLFTFQGFRYVKIEGYPGEINPENFTAIAIYSDMRVTGDFDCSNAMLNKLHSNILWSTKGNFVDVPMDCPTRERSGYTGDGQVFARTGAFLMETASFYSKWLLDMAADQRENGIVPTVIPDPGAHVEAGMLDLTAGSVGWADAVTIIPMTVYEVFADKQILEQLYPNMKRWVDYIENRAKQTHWSSRLKPSNMAGMPEHHSYIWDSDFHFGEWSEPDKNYVIELLSSLVFPRPMVATAYYAYSCQLLADAAGILGYDEDFQYYGSLASRIKEIWTKEFLKKDGKIPPDTQAAYVRAIALDLVPADAKIAIARKLVDKVREDNYHIATGFLSTPFICHVLSDYGYLEDAYRLLLQEERPSWLYPITKGATTMWEFWDAIKEDNSIRMSSHNHYSPGSIGSWLYEVVAGIRPGSPGYKNIIIQPQPGGGLTYARASYESLYGRITSSWQIEDNIFSLDVTIPPNTRAKIHLPDGTKVIEVGSGDYQYSCDWNTR